RSLSPNAPRSPPLWSRLLKRQELDFVVVVVVADEIERLRRNVEGRGDGHLDLARLFQARDLLALPVEQIAGDVLVDAHLNALDVLAVSSQLEEAHDVDTHAFARLDLAGAPAVWAILVDASFERGPDALAGHLDESELRDAQDLGAGP